MNKQHGFVNVAAVSPKVEIGNPVYNGTMAIVTLTELQDVDIVVFPELSITGYSCKDLFFNQEFLDTAWTVILEVAKSIQNQVVVMGCPIKVSSKLYNCAVVMNKGEVIGVVPKTHLPNFGEFEEARFFTSGKGCSDLLLDGDIPFGTDLLFDVDGAVIGVEICADLWTQIPPSSYQSMAGANILLNLSASNDIVGKDKYRKELVANQSGRCVAAYVYACSDKSESTSDTVMSGHSIIASNGKILAERTRFTDVNFIKSTIDIQALDHYRVSGSQYESDDGQQFNLVPVTFDHTDIVPVLPKNPFLDGLTNRRLDHILEIQTNGLAQRLSKLPKDTPVVIGVSGGLDSTLALLIAVEAFKKIGRHPSEITGITMPGFGTTETTKTNAHKLMELLGVTQKTISITNTCTNIFDDLEHNGEHDLTFENVQARYRTLLLMSNGFVIGTGDMSEIALGYCTYNGDHMSMYNVNCGVPKTLVKKLVQRNIVNGDPLDQGYYYDPVGVVLQQIVDMEYAHELIPEKEGEKTLSTEDIIGPYPLHDFFLDHFIGDGFGMRKMFDTALMSTDYDAHTVKKTLKTFITKFFYNQFKRSCVPDGPKVGRISLSPRGDWRMVSDVSVTEFLRKIEEIEIDE